MLSPGMRPRFFNQKMEQKEPEKKMPSTHAKATSRSAKLSALHTTGAGKVTSETRKCNQAVGIPIGAVQGQDVCVRRHASTNAACRTRWTAVSQRPTSVHACLDALLPSTRHINKLPEARTC